MASHGRNVAAERTGDWIIKNFGVWIHQHHPLLSLINNGSCWVRAKTFEQLFCDEKEFLKKNLHEENEGLTEVNPKIATVNENLATVAQTLYWIPETIV